MGAYTDYFNQLREDGLLTPLPEVAALIRPHKTWANYALLYKLAMDGWLDSARHPQTGRIFIAGNPDYIAQRVMERYAYRLGRWRAHCEDLERISADPDLDWRWREDLNRNDLSAPQK